MAPSEDVLIVGGGPAGLATALHLLAREPRLAERLVLLEGARYPREKFCAGALSARAELDLGALGVVVDVPSVPVSRIAVEMPNGLVAAKGGVVGRVVRRSEFDAELARIARARGLRLVEGAKVFAVEARASGVLVRSTAGDYEARAVVGADGVGSVVRRSCGLGGATWRAQVLEVDTPIVPTDPPRDTLLFDVRDRTFDGYEWDFPTVVDGEPLVCRGVYHLAMPGGRFTGTSLEERLSRRLARAGLDLAACKKKRYAERGFAPHEPCARPRVLLVGEAAGVDPITGEGIAQALLYGRVAASYLVEKLALGDFVFDDWSARLAQSTLGRDLALRHFLARRFFGPGRAYYEDALVELPSFLELGLRYFGGEHLPLPELAALALRAAGHFARAGAPAAWRTVDEEPGRVTPYS